MIFLENEMPYLNRNVSDGVRIIADNSSDFEVDQRIRVIMLRA